MSAIRARGVAYGLGSAYAVANAVGAAVSLGIKIGNGLPAPDAEFASLDYAAVVLVVGLLAVPAVLAGCGVARSSWGGSKAFLLVMVPAIVTSAAWLYVVSGALRGNLLPYLPYAGPALLLSLGAALTAPHLAPVKSATDPDEEQDGSAEPAADLGSPAGRDGTGLDG